MIRRRLRGDCPVLKPLLFILCALSLPSGVGAQAGGWQPSPGHTQIPIWPGAIPNARPAHGTEVSGTVVDARGRAKPVGGRPWVYVDSVSQPTMTVYSPAGANAGVTVVVFPGGGYNVLAIDLEGTEACEKRLYPTVDAADAESCRPDFAVALYPGHLAVRERNFALNPDIRVTNRTPPTLLVQAEDDPVDPVENSLAYHAALRKGGAPAEMHLYVKGGHAFGLRRTKMPISEWPAVVEQWLATIGMISR